MSVATLWLAIELFRWPNSLANGAFHRLADFMDPLTVSAYSFIVSLISIGALIANGRSKTTGPMIRSVCAILRAFLWSQFAYALYLLDPVSGPPSPPPSICFISYAPTPSVGLGFWVMFTIAELYVAYRAMGDVQRSL
jgi:hypothetical protein